MCFWWIKLVCDNRRLTYINLILTIISISNQISFFIKSLFINLKTEILFYFCPNLLSINGYHEWILISKKIGTKIFRVLLLSKVHIEFSIILISLHQNPSKTISWNKCQDKYMLKLKIYGYELSVSNIKCKLLLYLPESTLCGK